MAAGRPRATRRHGGADFLAVATPGAGKTTFALAAARRHLAETTGQTHAAVNAELNRMAGVRRITEATVDQLERRLRAADAWRRRP